MPDPQEVIKRLRAGDSELTVQVGREGEIIGEPTGYISTRCPTLDYLIGKPGIPLGGISVIVGGYGAGKSTICLNILAEAQATGGQAVIFDTEGRLNYDRAQKLGIDLDTLIVAQPDTLEELFDGVKKLIVAAREALEEDEHIVIVVDSIAGAPLAKEAAGAKLALGAQSILIRRELRVLSMLVNRQRIGLVITSQPRQRIKLGWGGGGNETHWLGEDPLGHAAMTTILLEEHKKFGDDMASPVGHVTMATLIDTRIAGCTRPECRECTRKDHKRTFDFYNATGPDFFSSAVDVLVEKKVLAYKGGWYTYGDKKYRRSDVEEKLSEWPELLDELRIILKGGHPDERTS